MSDAPKRYAQFLDQLLPFLDAAPVWFKIWIFVLIILIFATTGMAGVFYLISRGQQIARQSLQSFAVERPREGDQLPLGQSRSWMLEGQFPILAQDDKSGADVSVEVFRLPERNEVPQTGKSRISTVEGNWRFESAIFGDNGDYEIVVTGLLGTQKVYRYVKVVCLGKQEAYQNAIATDREVRGVQAVAPADPSAISLPAVQAELYAKEAEFFARYPRDQQAALSTVLSAFDIIDRALPAFPDDPVLQNFRAYMLKNYAMIMRDQGRGDEFDRALNESAGMFAALRQQNLNDASAWNGLGSVELLRGNPEKALNYINTALELEPGYPAALEDREQAEKMIRARSPAKT